MSRSQETFNKKQREKDRANKKKFKIEKREAKKDNTERGLEIDWSSAPENRTLTHEEQALKDANKANNLKQ